MNKPRIRAIIDYLRGVNAYNFYFGTCIRIDPKLQNSKTSEELIDATLNHECGTAVCAIGALPMIFPEDWEYRTLLGGFFMYYKGTNVNASHFWVRHIGNYLDITEDILWFFFMPDQYPNGSDTTATEVADRMEWALTHQDFIEVMEQKEISAYNQLIPY